MLKSRPFLVSVLALVFGFLAFLLFLPFGWSRWLGLLFAALGVTFGRFGKPQEKWQQLFSLLGMLLPALCGGLYILLYYL